MARKLASVQRVLEIVPIAGADAIEMVRINGWQCVVKKGTFSVGQQGVFFEIDAVPPDEPVYRFLWTPKGASPAEGMRPPKFRLRTMTLRGCLSQGLFLPLSEVGLSGDFSDGQEVTQQLRVEKYEPALPPGADELRAGFPSAVPRTDEERVQSAPGVLEELRGKPYVITLKCDGTSATYLVSPDDETFHACGRNWSLKDGPNVYWTIAKKLDLEALLSKYDGRYALQGELCGPGIQKNPLGLTETKLFVFSLFDLREQRFLDDAPMRSWCSENQLTPVPIVEEGDAFSHTLPTLLALAEGLYPGTKNQREGIVIRPRTETRSTTLGGRLSFKAISNKYLLGEKD